jgi:hypothetical protein
MGAPELEIQLLYVAKEWLMSGEKYRAMHAVPPLLWLPVCHRATFTKSRMATMRFSETRMIEPLWSIV